MLRIGALKVDARPSTTRPGDPSIAAKPRLPTAGEGIRVAPGDALPHGLEVHQEATGSGRTASVPDNAGAAPPEEQCSLQTRLEIPTARRSSRPCSRPTTAANHEFSPAAWRGASQHAAQISHGQAQILHLTLGQRGPHRGHLGIRGLRGRRRNRGGRQGKEELLEPAMAPVGREEQGRHATDRKGKGSTRSALGRTVSRMITTRMQELNRARALVERQVAPDPVEGQSKPAAALGGTHPLK